MKVALVAPVKQWAPPFSLMYVGTTLREHGYETHIFDDFEYFYAEPDDRRLGLQIERIREFGPGLIGIGCMSPEWPRARRIVRAIKDADIDAKILCGGRHPSLFPHHVLETGADFVCVGDGERLIVALLEALETGGDVTAIPGLAVRQNGQVLYDGSIAEYADLNASRMLDYSLVDYQAHMDVKCGIQGRYYRAGWILTSRGCPRDCSFCQDDIFGRKVRFRDIDLVLDELEYQLRNYNVEAFQINDDLFVCSERRVLAFCEGLARRGIHVKFACFARVDSISERTMAALKRAGCIQLAFGIESGSQRILDYYNKGVTVEQNRGAMLLANQYQIPVCAQVMVNGINETREDLQATIDLLKSVKVHMVVCGALTPMPGTELYRQTVRNGWLDPTRAKYDIVSPQPDVAVTMSPRELNDRVNDVYSTFSRSIFVKTLLRFSFREKRHFLVDMLLCALRDPAGAWRFVRQVLRGRYRMAINTFRKMLFTVHLDEPGRQGRRPAPTVLPAQG